MESAPAPIVEPSPSPSEETALWAWLLRFPACADAEAAVLDLCRTLLTTARAERAFLVDLDAAGRVRAAWGVDLDGIALAEPSRRVAADVLDRALRQTGPLYQRGAAFPGGSGSRLVARCETRAGATLAIVEHRFREGAFDHVTAAAAERWAALGAIATRASAAPAAAAPVLREESPRDADRAGSVPREGARPASAADPFEGSLTTVLPLPAARRAFPAIVGESLAIRRARAQLDAAVDTDLPVLLVGETGTGKELFARALHEHGARGGRELVAMNCGSVPEALFEAELFGHARGAFTGADRARPGLLARAEGGTLFLDEIGELPVARQAVLLRALESRRFRPVGSDDERPFDVRVVSATNRDLARAADERAFRTDLLYRLNVVTIAVPPLRARGGDVPLLVEAFLRERGRADLEVDGAAMTALCAYPWPGNVRELKNLVDRMAGLPVGRVRLDHLPRAIRAAARAGDRAARAEVVRPAPLPTAGARSTAGARPPDDLLREETLAALDAEGGNISRAAARLGLTRHGLKKRLRRLGLRGADERRRVS